MAELTLDKSKTALLVMDMQNDQYSAVTKAGAEGGILKNVVRVIDGARNAGVPVIYVVARFRPGHPEAHPRNAFQQHNQKVGRLVEGTDMAAIHPECAPKEGEIVVTKRRVNAFFNTDLDIVLRAKGIDTLVMTGIATGGVILSTVRYAADADYVLAVLEDCSADPDQDRGRCLLQHVLPGQATIATADDFLKAIA